MVTTTAYSGSTLKNAVSVPNTDHSANALRSAHADNESSASQEGAGSPTAIGVGIHEHDQAESVNIPQM